MLAQPGLRPRTRRPASGDSQPPRREAVGLCRCPAPWAVHVWAPQVQGVPQDLLCNAGRGSSHDPLALLLRRLGDLSPRAWGCRSWIRVVVVVIFCSCPSGLDASVLVVRRGVVLDRRRDGSLSGISFTDIVAMSRPIDQDLWRPPARDPSKEAFMRGLKAADDLLEDPGSRS